MSTPESANTTVPTSLNPPLVVPLPAHLLSSGTAKIRDQQRARKAIVYIRQSSPQQVAENKESTARQ